jgi:hypothetical protein
MYVPMYIFMNVCMYECMQSMYVDAMNLRLRVWKCKCVRLTSAMCLFVKLYVNLIQCKYKSKVRNCLFVM